MEWVKNGGIHTSGEYRIEQVWAPAPRNHAWFVTGPNWVGGTVPTLAEAKQDCENHAADAAFDAAQAANK